MMVNVTAKMREVLRRMQAGETLIECQGRAWLIKDGSASICNYRTFRALWYGCLIGRGALRHSPALYIYSVAPEGRKAIEAQP